LENDLRNRKNTYVAIIISLSSLAVIEFSLCVGVAVGTAICC